MAASLSRPDPTSPASVAEATFSSARRGFSNDEVRAFLTSVATELGRLKERERQLDAELRAARAGGGEPVELDEATVSDMLGEETLRVLQTARESATQIKVRAEENAARVMRDAHDESNRTRQEAELEAARRRQDAQAEAEAEVAHAKQEGREMVNEARAYRERVLADLDRRTRIARQQIEELTNGRDRLLQVFERARLVAVDVTSNLQAAIGPDEFVSLAPTTGPVPLMVPADRAAAATNDEVDVAHGIDDDIDDIDDDIADIHDGAGDDTAVETVDGETSAGAGEERDTAESVGTSDGAETDDAAIDADADAVAEGVAAGVAEPEPSAERAHNVVALFPDRREPESSEPDESGHSGQDGGDAVARPDVDDVFARLRQDVGADESGEAPPTPAYDPDSPFGRRDETLVPLILTAARKLKRVLADEQNGVLDTLRRNVKVTALDAVLPAIDAHAETYATAIAGELGHAAAGGAVELGAKSTASLRTSLAKAGALDAARAALRTELIAPLRQRLERAVADGGGDNEDIAKRVRAVYREFKSQHIDDHLDDVFRAAYGGGLAATIKPGTIVSWVLDPSRPACADCEDNSLATGVVSGDSFPTGHAAAPAHPGCRCLTLPVS